MSPELDTLDQLQARPLPLGIIIQIYENEERFRESVLALLRAGDVRLESKDGTDIAPWRWRELFLEGKVMIALNDFVLRLTPQDETRIGGGVS